MQLTSTSVTEGEAIDLRYAAPDAAGDNVRPQLSWSGAPEATRSFAITCYDPDAPTGSGFWHWIAADLPASTTTLDEDQPLSAPAREWVNDYGQPGWGGPCPPPGPAHRYVFTVHALPVEKLDVPDDAAHVQVRFTIFTTQLDSASVTGTFALPADAS